MTVTGLNSIGQFVPPVPPFQPVINEIYPDSNGKYQLVCADGTQVIVGLSGGTTVSAAVFKQGSTSIAANSITNNATEGICVWNANTVAAGEYHLIVTDNANNFHDLATVVFS
jgi:hypothetical protein